MPPIEITTTQNVVIQIQPASLMDRILAYIIDLIIIILSFLMLFYFVITVFEISPNRPISYLLPIFILSFYSLLFERFMEGKTPGKLLLNTKVVKIDGSQPEGIDYFKRWSLRFLDIYLSLGAFALLSVASSRLGQRFGDVIANTMVIKSKNGIRYSLSQISGLHNSEDYVPQYADVLKLDIKHILTLNKLLKKFDANKRSNRTKEMLHNTALQMEEVLGIKRNELTDDKFLRQLVKDYVILTR